MSVIELITYTVDCPYCGEYFSTSIDPSIERETYYEDCQICCQPIYFSVSGNTEDGKIHIVTSREY